MSFVYDSTTLPATKVVPDGVVIPTGQETKYIGGDDVNKIMQACYDLRTAYAEGYAVQVKSYGAKGDCVDNTGTDDRAAIQAAVNSAINLGLPLRLGAGVTNRYKISKYIDINGAHGLKILGGGAVTIRYQSDDLSIATDTVATSYTAARSAFVVRNSTDVTIEGLGFDGGNTPEVIYSNVGVAIFPTRSVGLRIINCVARDGNALIAQTALVDTRSTAGGTLAVSLGVVTLTNNGDINSAFHPGMVGRTLRLNNTANLVNNGTFRIISVIGTTQLTYANAAAVAEVTATFVWSVDDADADTKVIGCRSENCRAYSYTGSGGSFIDCTFTRPMTPDLLGIPLSFAISGTTVTMTDPAASWTTDVIGRYVKVAGSTSAANDGIYQITGAVAKTTSAAGTITYTNAAGVTELGAVTTSTWWIAGGERSGLGGGATAIASASGVVTFTAAAAIFRADDVGKVIVLTDATTAANNGNKIVSRYISPTQVQYISSAAVSETYAKVFSIDGYDNCKGDSTVGPPLTRNSTAVGAGSLTDSGLTALVNAYAGRILTDSANQQWAIASNTATVFTLLSSGTPASGAYTVSASETHGSSHVMYFFAGRDNIEVIGCRFEGIRTYLKVSGSALPIRGFRIADNTFVACGAGVVFGADDVQEHSNLNIHDNVFVDCGLGRAGWGEQQAINVLGARNVKIHGNQFHATHDAVSSRVNGGALGGFYGVIAGRFVAGISQPLQAVDVSDNTFTIDAQSANPARVAAASIELELIGQRAKWRTGGTLTKSGSTMTLADSSAEFSQQDVGSTIQICNAPDAGNNSTTVLEAKVGEFAVLSVSGTGSLTYTNASGVGGGVAAGTYRINPKVASNSRRGSTLNVCNNGLSGYGATGISLVGCTAPQVTGNVFNGHGTCIADSGSVAPHIAKNIEVQAGSNSARITITAGTSWPIIYDNFITNGALAGGNLTSEGSATRTDMGVGVGSGTSVDHPLMGLRGRAIATGAKPQMVFAFGSQHVDGDTLSVLGTTFTFKAASPDNGTGGTFATAAGLILCIDHTARVANGLGSLGVDCKDYGAQFSPSVTTGHILIQNRATSATANALYIDTINVLNPTALVIPRNAIGGGEAFQYSRGEGAAGPTPDKFVVWSMQSSLAGGAMLQADNDTGLTALVAGYRTVKDSNNAGCCEVIKHGTYTEVGGEAVRWRLL